MSISRRRFLCWMGAAGFGAALSNSAKASSNKHFTGYSESLGVLHDTVLCVGCRECEAMCNKVNKLPAPEQPFTDKTVLYSNRRTTTKAYTVVNRYPDITDLKNFVYIKDQCNHCLEPACVSACFVQALKKTASGPVVYDATVCVGCRYCMIACPFDVPAYEYDDPFTPSVIKCTMCAPRLEKGLLPGCVEACPREALTFGKRKDLIRIARQRISQNPDHYIDHIYGEHEMGGTSWLYLAGVPFKSIGMREDLGFTSAPALTSGALSVVPMVAGLWPVFLTGMYAMTRRREKIAMQEKEQDVAVAVQTTEAKAQDKLAKAVKKIKTDMEKALKKAALDKEKAVKAALKEIADATKKGRGPDG